MTRYVILQFMCGQDEPQAYVLSGRGEYLGIDVELSPAEVLAYTDVAALTAFLDARFGEAVASRARG